MSCTYFVFLLIRTKAFPDIKTTIDPGNGKDSLMPFQVRLNFLKNLTKRRATFVMVMHLYNTFSVYIYILKCGLHQHMSISDLILPTQPMKS